MLHLENVENSLFEVVKEKTIIKGFWIDENGKLFKDNIKLFKPSESFLELDNKINDLFFKGEKCIFIRGKKKAFLVYPQGQQEVLNTLHSFIVDNGKYSFSEYKVFIKGLLRDYKGFTAFKREGFIIFESWTK